MRVVSEHPTPAAIWRVLVAIGEALGEDECIRRNSHYEFRAGSGRQVWLTPESAGRVRLDLCTDGEKRRSLWRRSEDLAGLALAVAELRDPVCPGTL